MADDMISRQAAIDLLKQMRKDGDMVPWEGKDVFARIRKLPSVQLERKKGEWVGYPDCLKYPNAYADDHIVCSACEECFSILDNCTERFNYCPHCGADMRKD